ncbi:MAG: peptide deformylase [Burkholderiaceae bacterium]
MIHPILRMGDPRLLRIAKPVERFDTAELHALVADLFETMRHANGAGLAAPQIGVDLRLVIFGFAATSQRYPDADPVPETVLLNPVVELLQVEQREDWEGCLSVPGMRGIVPRTEHVRYRGFDQFGKPVARVATGFHARVVQHECDHLDGILYPMRITDFSRFGFTEELFPGEEVIDD